MNRLPKIKSMLGLIIVLMLIIYMIFGKHGNKFWSSFYYITIDSIVLWLCYIGSVLSDRLIKISIYCLSAIFLICFITDLISFFNTFVFIVINHSYLIGGIVLVVIISILVYEMVKRKMGRFNF